MLFKLLIIFSILLPIVFGLNGKQLIEYAVKQYTKLSHTLKSGIQYPSQGLPTDSTWNTTGAVKDQWTAGFYPGVLWHLYNYTKNDYWKQLAIITTDALFDNQFRSDSMDIGFMIMSSYGLGYELTQNASYPKVIVNAANSLAKRFNPVVGCTRSRNGEPNEFLVIVDNMMNLELLFMGYELSGNQSLYDMAVSHTNRTIREHLRKDYSSYQIVNFNSTTGEVIRRYQADGYNDSSTWTQGQAWLINGFTIAYKYTKSKHFLEAAENVTKYYLDNLPDDKIAPWDFNVPKQLFDYIPRDTTSAAIAADGLFALYGHSKNDLYLKSAKQLIDSLSSDKYRANGLPVYDLPALLANATIAGPNAAKDRSDIALIFGDFYFVKSFKYLL